jgi:hypothetical protein
MTPKRSVPTAWFDLPAIEVAIEAIVPGVDQCTITGNDGTKLQFLLLAGGMISVQPGSPMPEDDLLVAMGRVIVAYGPGDLTPPRDHAALFRALNGSVVPWPDLPNLHRVEQAVDERLTQLGVGNSREAAAIFATNHATLPMAWAWFSTPSPSRRLLVGFGRLLFEHYRQDPSINP